jgi:hypothetical protein
MHLIVFQYINGFFRITMKAMSFLLLALGAASASACHQYRFCTCLNSDGQQNDTVTGTACNDYGKEMYLVPGPSSGHQQCTSEHSADIGMDNCHWKKLCGYFGATGDSSRGCSVKTW